MCESCGRQAVAAIDEPTREHDRVVGPIAQARARFPTLSHDLSAPSGRAVPDPATT
jgi:hypothetical protein